MKHDPAFKDGFIFEDDDNTTNERKDSGPWQIVNVPVSEQASQPVPHPTPEHKSDEDELQAYESTQVNSFKPETGIIHREPTKPVGPPAPRPKRSETWECRVCFDLDEVTGGKSGKRRNPKEQKCCGKCGHKKGFSLRRARRWKHNRDKRRKNDNKKGDCNICAHGFDGVTGATGFKHHKDFYKKCQHCTYNKDTDIKKAHKMFKFKAKDSKEQQKIPNTAWTCVNSECEWLNECNDSGKINGACAICGFMNPKVVGY